MTGPSGSSSTIELAFISPGTEFNTATTILPLSTSDHQGVKLSMNLKTCHVKAKSSSRRTIWLYTKADFNKACDMVDDTDWDQIISNNSDIDHCWNLWHKRFLEIMDECSESSSPKEKEPSLAFPSSHSLAINKTKQPVFWTQKERQSWQISAVQTVQKVRNGVVSLLRSAKRAYFKNLNTTDTKKFWRAMKFLNNQKSSIPNLQVNDKSVTGDVDKADVFNKRFYGNFNQYHCYHPTTLTWIHKNFLMSYYVQRTIYMNSSWI